MIYCFISYVVLGLLTSAAIYVLEDDEWESGEKLILIPAFFFWPIPFFYILGYYALRPLILLRNRIHRKKEALTKKDKPLRSPRAGTLWEEETRTPENSRR